MNIFPGTMWIHLLQTWTTPAADPVHRVSEAESILLNQKGFASIICFIPILFLNGSWFPAIASAIAHVQLPAKPSENMLGRAISLGSAAPEGKHLLLGAVLIPQ